MTKIERCSHETERIDTSIGDDGHLEDDEETGVETLIVTPPSFRERLEAAKRVRATSEVSAVPADQPTRPTAMSAH
jgi:hypothetical protein